MVEICRTASPVRTIGVTPIQTKNPRPMGEGFMFGRTSQIRTGDLYHVKANRPHQDTRGLTYARVEMILGQAPGL